MAPNTKNILIGCAFVAVAGLAVAGWVRKNDRAVDPAVASLQGNPYVGSTVASPDGQPVAAYQPQGSVPQPVYAGDGYYPSRMRPVYVRQQPMEPMAGQPVAQYVDEPVQGPTRRVVSRQEYYTDSRGKRHTRSKAHSVEIVAGSAAAGAAIGALAGGGKGAAIGALSGGGAGFVYDRLTHNH